MVDFQRNTCFGCVSLVKCFRLKWSALSIAPHLLEALIHLLQILALIVEILEIKCTIDLPIAHRRNHITQIRFIFGVAARNGRIPVVRAVIRCISGNPIEATEAVERHCPLRSEHLLIGVRRAELRETALNGVFPCLIIVVGEMIITDDFWSIKAFVNHGVHTRLERKLEALSQVVFDIHIAIPKEIFGERKIHLLLATREVAHLQMIESAVHVG